MKQLYDETHGEIGDYNRTLWYTYLEGEYDSKLIEKLVNIIKTDLAAELEKVPSATNWVFYTETQEDDAIGDKVRASLMVRERDGLFVANYNMSDYDFVIAYDRLEAFKLDLLAELAKVS